MQDWAQLYAVVGAAAATLLGLLFVAVSINASKVLGSADALSRGLAEQAFRSYITTIYVSLLALFPAIPLPDFARAALAGSASSAVIAIVSLRLLGFVRTPGETRWRSLISRVLASSVGYGLLIVAEARMAFLGQNERTSLAAGVLVLLLSATLTSWELLMRLAAGPIAPLSDQSSNGPAPIGGERETSP